MQTRVGMGSVTGLRLHSLIHSELWHTVCFDSCQSWPCWPLSNSTLKSPGGFKVVADWWTLICLSLDLLELQWCCYCPFRGTSSLHVHRLIIISQLLCFAKWVWLKTLRNLFSCGQKSQNSTHWGDKRKKNWVNVEMWGRLLTVTERELTVSLVPPHGHCRFYCTEWGTSISRFTHMLQRHFCLLHQAHWLMTTRSVFLLQQVSASV